MDCDARQLTVSADQGRVSEESHRQLSKCASSNFHLTDMNGYSWLRFADAAVPRDPVARNVVAEVLKAHPRAWLWDGANAWMVWIVNTFLKRTTFVSLFTFIIGGFSFRSTLRRMPCFLGASACRSSPTYVVTIRNLYDHVFRTLTQLVCVRVVSIAFLLWIAVRVSLTLCWMCSPTLPCSIC